MINTSGRSNLDELLDVLEEIRKENYPHIPQEIIREIVITQYDNQDKRPEARNGTNLVVSNFLNKVIQSEEG